MKKNGLPFFGNGGTNVGYGGQKSRNYQILQGRRQKRCFLGKRLVSSHSLTKSFAALQCNPVPYQEAYLDLQDVIKYAAVNLPITKELMTTALQTNKLIMSKVGSTSFICLLSEGLRNGKAPQLIIPD
jgi:hypothetical protein